MTLRKPCCRLQSLQTNSFHLKREQSAENTLVWVFPDLDASLSNCHSGLLHIQTALCNTVVRGWFIKHMNVITLPLFTTIVYVDGNDGTGS